MAGPIGAVERASNPHGGLGIGCLPSKGETARSERERALKSILFSGRTAVARYFGWHEYIHTPYDGWAVAESEGPPDVLFLPSGRVSVVWQRTLRLWGA